MNRSTTPAPENLERAADALLRASRRDLGAGEYPFYSERWMRLRRRREEKSGDTPAPSEPHSARHFKVLLELLIKETPLSAEQREILRLAQEGASLTAIARHTGRPLSTVHRWYQQGRERVRHSAERVLAVSHHPALIRLAFHEQTSPPLYSPEHHCAPGREACRRDGLCRHRWYLYPAERD